MINGVVDLRFLSLPAVGLTNALTTVSIACYLDDSFRGDVLAGRLILSVLGLKLLSPWLTPDYLLLWKDSEFLFDRFYALKSDSLEMCWLPPWDDKFCVLLNLCC